MAGLVEKLGADGIEAKRQVGNYLYYMARAALDSRTPGLRSLHYCIVIQSTKEVPQEAA